MKIMTIMNTVLVILKNGEHGGEFMEAFSWTSEYGADSIFSKF